MKFKPNSRRSKLITFLKTNGDGDAAQAFGESIGLAAGTVRTWRRMWREGAWTDAAKPTIRTEPGQRRVHVKDWPERVGTVIKAGPEVSEVRWDDGENMGQYVINEHLCDAQ